MPKKNQTPEDGLVIEFSDWLMYGDDWTATLVLCGTVRAPRRLAETNCEWAVKPSLERRSPWYRWSDSKSLLVGAHGSWETVKLLLDLSREGRRLAIYVSQEEKIYRRGGGLLGNRWDWADQNCRCYVDWVEERVSDYSPDDRGR